MAIVTAFLPAISGYVETEYEHQRVYRRLSDDRLFWPSLEPVVPFTQSELREKAYESMRLIDFGGSMLTVDEAGIMFWRYYPDSTQHELADRLKDLISTAKDTIREMYPDEPNGGE